MLDALYPGRNRGYWTSRPQALIRRASPNNDKKQKTQDTRHKTQGSRLKAQSSPIPLFSLSPFLPLIFLAPHTSHLTLPPHTSHLTPHTFRLTTASNFRHYSSPPPARCLTVPLRCVFFSAGTCRPSTDRHLRRCSGEARGSAACYGKGGSFVRCSPV